MNDLVTERLLLHPLSVAEAEQLMERGPAPGGEYPTEMDLVGVRRYLEACATAGDPQPFGDYEIRVRADGRTIGGAGFHGTPNEDNAVTIGYGLVESARGKGYAAEALRGLLQFARERGIASVLGDTDRDNVASQHVMAAAGMHLVSEDDKLMYYAARWQNAPST
ncbi:GNAT family N-acetyltransferase [Actinomadura barringtoniae]|uniref:GNAT family N-acetyltransferase n=1 Tax=Actinomadura barringtoniae TaxID=1427535 RepID=A0A939TGW1_9ACTN|nr:GNAT family N-acetyltransferase [Actinomadura barringtoniae]MBO2455830.1 GNAT family N-acetyltransferase [Actinomadura barringtoniae]